MMGDSNVSVDLEANAGYIVVAQGVVQRTLPVFDGDDVVATLDFGESGELLGVELLNARVQLKDFI